MHSSERTTRELVKAFRGFHAATVYEASGRTGDMGPEISTIVPGFAVLGLAYTVKCWPGDGRAFMEAVDAAEPGDVLVIDGGGTDRFTTFGGNAAISAQRRGITGVVTNGAVRDSHQFRELGFPVFAAGTAVRGGLRAHPGWRGITVSVGQVPVSPGDLVIGDDDGVVVVAADRIAEVLEKTKVRSRKEQESEDRIRAGGPYFNRE